MAEALKALVEIISTQTATLLSAYAANGAEFPSLNEPFNPTASKLESDPALTKARQLIVAAAAQLMATVQAPKEFFMHDVVPAMLKPATIGFVIDANIPEILMEADPKGLHVRDLSTATDVSESHLGPVMRFLATRHIFREITPNVFTHNRHSILLSKNKSAEELKADPLGRFDNSPFNAYLHMATDELLTSSTLLSTYLRNPEQAPAAFNIAHKTPKKLWEWYDEPGNKWRMRRFANAMKANGELNDPEIFIAGIAGEALKPNDVVVDVGGSVGTVTLTLKTAFPELRYVVQDLGKVIPAGEKYWKEHDPEALKSGQVILQAHNFFNPQPIKNAAIYFMRLVLHDWPDKDAHRILSNLRDAAGPDSKLIMFEHLVRHACRDSSLENHSIPLAEAPYPLLENLGVGGDGLFTTAMNLNMLLLFNGKERTLHNLERLGKETGWRLQTVKPGTLFTFTFTPAEV